MPAKIAGKHQRVVSPGALLPAVLLLLTSSAFAHPGHGSTEPGRAAHYLLEPLHVAPFVSLLMAGGAVATYYLRRRLADLRRSRRYESTSR